MGIVLEEVRVQSTERLDRVVLEVLAKDVQTVLRYVAAEELRQQLDVNNPPTSLLVDNRSRKPIDEAEKRVQMFFADIPTVREAVYEAWNQVVALTRIRTGRAVSAYQLWYNETPIGATPAACELYLDRFNPATDYFRIVGPVIVYGRKIYWNPKGEPKFTKRTRYRFPQINTSIKLIRIRGIMNRVEQSLRRRFRYIAITEDWVVTPALPKDGRTPGLWIGFKRKGSLLDQATGAPLLLGRTFGV